MYLRRLTLENIRCFTRAELDFDRAGGANRKWTVLVGENGTGKSTVLRSVALMMAGSDALWELVGEPDDWITWGRDAGRITLDIETARGEVRTLTLDFHRGEGRGAFLRRAPDGLGPLDGALSHTSRNYPVFGYGSSRRLAPPGLTGTRARRHPRARALATLFDREAELHPLTAWAMQMDYRSDGADVDIVRDVLAEFLPELEFLRIDKAHETLIFRTPDGEIALEQLSDGYQNAAAWVGDLLYQIAEIWGDRRKPLEVRGLLIVDEVDLHLHPKWQRRLLHLLHERLPNMQLLVTTHAVMTAQQTPDASLFYTIRREAGCEIAAFEGDPGKLLLNQLVATEAFGHLADESVEIARAKDRYRDLSRKEAQTGEDRAELSRLADKIGQMPEDDAEQIVMSPAQRRLMQRIIAEAEGQGGEGGGAA